MQVLKKIHYNDNNIITNHQNNRYKRISKYNGLLSIEFIDCFLVDNNHINGLEIHCINKYGLIYIYNIHSDRLITILHPRPKQIKRYYNQLSITYNSDIRSIIDKCYKRNLNSNLNNL
jgi:hypothetical protein